MPTLLLSANDLRSLYSVELGLTAVERAFRAHGLGEALMPAKVYLSLPKYDGDFRAMPAFLDGAAGVKWVNAHPRNMPQRFYLRKGPRITLHPKRSVYGWRVMREER